MAIYTKESLETLRQRIDLVDVLSSHLDLKKAGAAYKALCPFHDEKTPSFMIQRGDTHYHCFGCGAHGDAIQFLMSQQKMSFSDAIENLAHKYQVHLEKVEGGAEIQGPNKGVLKEALDHACRFYHFYLLHTPEGHEALKYLYSRGIDLDFIRLFQLGLAPKFSGLFRKTLHAKFISDETMLAAGLLAVGKDQGWREFFSDRITIPIRDPQGSVIGFSARKYKEETFGGKYVNTSETVLFKKSRILFGLNYSRRRIAKERRVIVVEGQIDALKLIQAGFNITVAGQGTAFGEGHVKELIALGVNHVWLALDSDEAGHEAAIKIGNLFQKEGIEVKVVKLPQGSDPDSFLRDKGSDPFLKLLQTATDYLEFLVWHQSRKLNMDSPAGKNELIKGIIHQIREWEQPVMVHESLRKLAQLVKVPEEAIGVGQEYIPNLYIKKSASVGLQVIDPHRILETDFLRWLLLVGAYQQQFVALAKENIQPEMLRSAPCRQLYQTFLEHVDLQMPTDFLTLAAAIDDSEGQLLMTEIMHKKINKDRAEQQFIETIQKILDRNWMELREGIKLKIQSGQCSDDEALEMVKQFDALKKNPPQIQGC